MREAPIPGGRAEQPAQIPGRGWWAISKRIYIQIGTHNLSLVAAGCAFFALLAVFPAITACVSLYGLVSDPAQVQAQVQSMQGVLPEQALTIVQNQLRAVASTSQQGLSWGLGLSLAFALWTASAGIKALFSALNIVYREAEERSFVRFAAQGLLFTLAAILAVIVAVFMITVVPAALALLALGPLVEPLVSLLRWPLLALLMMIGLAFLYRYGPSRANPRWTWVSWGAVIATVFWVAASIGFSLYVANFGSYDKTYGSLGAVVVLMFWLYISAFVVLLGAELNAELEHQTAHDTTTGKPQPAGERGAFVADHQPDQAHA